jgi:hypothetical protein
MPLARLDTQLFLRVYILHNSGVGSETMHATLLRMVVDYGDIQRSIKEVYDRILDFVGIAHHKFTRKLSRKQCFERHAYLPLDDSTKKALEAFYAPYNAELKDIIGEEWRDIWVQGKMQFFLRGTSTPLFRSMLLRSTSSHGPRCPRLEAPLC